MSKSRLTSVLLTPLVSCVAVAQDGLEAELRAWFARPVADRGAAPGDDVELSRAAADRWLPKLVAMWREGARGLGRETLAPNGTGPEAPGELVVGDYRMPYVLLEKGEKPAGGWPLYLCLHGGGGNAAAEGPHAWSVNTREWQAQQMLQQRIYPSPGLYFVPRMADDREGRWWFDHNQKAFEQVIRQGILFRDVDPDRVYLLGISEGGYGAIRFAGNRPDRFAACGGMAAAEPLDTSPPEDMRNVALRIDIGEKDTMFDRVGLARRMGQRLEELRAADPGGYDFVLDVHAGRGHGIDYAPCPKWLATKVRDPRPDRVVWTVRPFHRDVALQRHWLALPSVPASMPRFVAATLREQRLTVTFEQAAEGGARTAVDEGQLLVRLDDRLADLDREIALVVNGVERPRVRARRSLATMARTLAERDDPRLCFPAELVVELAPR